MTVDTTKLQRVAPQPDQPKQSPSESLKARASKYGRPTRISDRRTSYAKNLRLFGSVGNAGARRESMSITQLYGIQRRLAWERFQQSRPVVLCRKFFHGKIFGGLSVLCLLGALYLPDAYVLLNAADATFGDVVLSLIMFIFATEFLVLSIVDPAYLLSTFWAMDFVGTISMLFDITYMYGSSPDEGHLERSGHEESGDGTGKLVYLRASRMAKLGARAGRISRILKILRFLPFLKVSEQDSTTMAKKISNQLSQVLGTRVAFLTLIVAIVMPIPGIFQFPVYDYSLRTTPASIARRLAELVDRGHYDSTALSVQFRDEDRDRLFAELTKAVEFYSQISYGPSEIYVGICTDTPPGCSRISRATELIIPSSAWTPTFQIPYRLADALFVSVNLGTLPSSNPEVTSAIAALDSEVPWRDFEFVIVFNFRKPHVDESSWNMGVITFIMSVMVGFGLVLANSVSKLALQPMERMLQMVREIARTVFSNFDTEENELEQDDDDHVYDADTSTEMALLERIVRRLATMAELTTKKVADIGMDRSDMKAEDVGIINLMSGNVHNVDEEKKSDPPLINELKPMGVMNSDCSTRTPVSEKESVTIGSTYLELNLGPEEDVFDSWNFIPKAIESVEARIALPTWIILHNATCGDFARKLIPAEKLHCCMIRAEDEYLDANPYHNFLHALDVMHTENRLFKLCHIHVVFRDLEVMALLLSAVFHDVAHPGLNNPFLIDSGHRLALLYNDRSPLENMHCARLFSIVGEKDAGILDGFSKEQYRETRKICVEVILHTDVVLHFAMVKDLKILYQVNSEIFEYCNIDFPPNPEEIAIFKADDTKKLLLNMFLHTADVSNPCKPWDVCRYWSHCVLEEFFQQGDKEKELGMTVQMLNDRHKVNRPNSQLGFIEFIVSPLVVSCIKLFPHLFEFGDNIESNVQEWNKVWISESSPGQEEQDKVIARLEKLTETITESKSRILRIADGDDSSNAS